MGISTATDGLHVATNTNVSSIAISNMNSECISLIDGATEFGVDNLSINGCSSGISMISSYLETLIITNSHFSDVTIGISLGSTVLKTFKVDGCEFNGIGRSRTAISRSSSSSNSVEFEVTNSTIMNYHYPGTTANGIYMSTSENVQATISNVQFSNLTCSNGCGIYVTASNLEMNIQNSLFRDSSASLYGALYINSDEAVTISNSQFINCQSGGNGGAIYYSQYSDGELTVDSCVFQNNEAVGNGGALAAFSEASVTGCEFIQNSAVLGGAIYSSTSLTVSDSDFTQNTVSSNGGALYLTGTSSNIFTISGCVMTGNTASGDGGAIYSEVGTVQLTEAVIDKNNADGNGGGIYIEESSVTVVKGLIRNNSANSGGGIYLDSYPASANLKFAVFGENQAAAEGGGLVCDNDASVFMQYMVFKGNEGTDGSAYYCDGCSLTSFGVRVNSDNSISGC